MLTDKHVAPIAIYYAKLLVDIYLPYCLSRGILHHILKISSIADFLEWVAGFVTLSLVPPASLRFLWGFSVAIDLLGPLNQK